MWNEDEISSPLLPTACTIESAVGTFSYETLTLPVSNAHAIVVQVPEDDERDVRDVWATRFAMPLF